jgi:hypothetical protein
MNTTENNKIIAEFMGLVESSIPNRYWTKKSIEGFGEGKMVELQYHEDWNYLMEVVKKIRSIDNKSKEDFKTKLLHYQRNNKTIFDLSILEGKVYVYNACVDFIKWYNEQKKLEK